MRPTLLLLATACAASTPPPGSRIRAPSAGAAVASPPTAPPAASRGGDPRITHLLHRAAFGPSPGDVERVRSLGLDGWLEIQLAPGVDAAMEARLGAFKTLRLSVAEATLSYPPLRKRLAELGVEQAALEKDPEARRRIKERMRADGEGLPRQLLVEATQAKLLRAVGSERQLEEVLVDFWFNHFNVSAEKNQVRWMVTAYERDAVRPHVFGRFRELLGATAKHPAMLRYLDNFSSVRDGFDPPASFGKGVRLPKGLNENYARELLELHTVGVGAGYTQTDVHEAARALTGWSLEFRPRSEDFGRFAFHRVAHDLGAKYVFGLDLPAGGAMDDGERLLDHLARHPATARFLARKLCVRFVSDTPSPELVEAVAQEYLRTDGDLTATYRAVFRSTEFWSDQAVGSKTKTPLEFVASAIRAVGTLDSAELPLGRALEQLGAPPYRCSPPTGYAEHAGPWVSAGGLVSRINFGLQLATGRVKGVTVALPPPGPTLTETVDAVAIRVLGAPPGEATRGIIVRALRGSDDDGVADGEARRADPARIAGLLLGSPEFQRQ